MTPTNLCDYQPDQKTSFEPVLDYMCHLLLTQISPSYRALKAVGSARANQIAAEIRAELLEFSKGDEWEGYERALAYRAAVLKHLEEGGWLNTGGAAPDSTEPVNGTLEP
jgi:hypothetical protein